MFVSTETKQAVRSFLRAIWADFVDTVDIVQSRLLDDLIAAGVINSTDSESLNGTHLPTRSEQAR